MARQARKVEWIVNRNGCHICISHAPNKNGYPTKKHNGKTVSIFRHLYQEKNGKLPSDVFLLHSCDNRLCIALHHLSEGSNYDNVQDMVKKKRHAHGESAPSAKLSSKIVKKIRNSNKSTRELADTYQVSQSTIRRARNGTHWK
jgi:DNA-binding transcriptional regulator YiaG